MTRPKIQKMLIIVQMVRLLWNYPNISAGDEILNPMGPDESPRSMGRKAIHKFLWLYELRLIVLF